MRLEDPTSHATSWASLEEAARYERGRPNYPPEAAGVIAEHLRLGPGAVVADVAAGTGKLTRVLASTGATVLAVEPMAGMRQQLRVASPGATVIAGKAEAMPLRSGCLRGVTVAQAVHWFRQPDAATELARVLAPEGRLAIVTNNRDRSWPYAEEVGAILARYEALGPRPQSVRRWRAAFDAAGAFETVARVQLAHEQRFETGEEFDSRFSSVSFAILLDPADRSAMLSDLRAAVPGAGEGPVVIPLVTTVEILRPVARPGRP